MTADTRAIRSPGAPALGRLRTWLPQGRGLPAEDWTRRHRGLLAILWLHALAVPAFGIAQGYPVWHALAEGGLIAVAAAIATWAPLTRTLRAGAVSVGLLTASAELVHFSGGYIEFHFHFFVMIALLSLYQHWLPFLAAVGYVGVHHGLAGVLDPDAVYNHPSAVAHPWEWAGIHAVFVLAAGAANVFTWRLSEEEQKRRRDLELVTEAALAHLPLAELLDEVLGRIREVLGADVATVALRDETEDSLRIRAADGATVASDGDSISLSGGVIARTLESRASTVALDATAEDLDNPVLRAAGVRSVAAVALLVEGTAIGVLDVGVDKPRRFGKQEVSLLQLVADRIAPAIDRARLHEREHRIAETLQRSLLPKQLPSVPGLQLGFRYRPAGQGLAAGGDWYDAVLLPRGGIGLAIGDVVGHGTDAASLMGQLRTGLRAYAMEGHRPAELLNRLDELTLGLGEMNMATLVYLELRPESGLVNWVSAGHPPPVLRRPDGAVATLDGPTGVPLGMIAGPRYVEKNARLEPGSTLVLYSDGLVESRKTGIDQGLATLQRILAEQDPSDVEVLCDSLLAEVPPADGGGDDVALLVVKLAATLGKVLDVEFPAEPASTAAMRRTLERWLAEQQVPEDDAYAIVTASSEAAANAVEHAYGPKKATYGLLAERANGTVTVAIRDHGRWRDARGRNRGRGLPMMKALVDDVEIHRGPDGTTLKLRKHLPGNGRGAPAR